MEDFNQERKETPISIGDWMFTMLLMCIPVANFVLLLVWAFGEGYPKSKSNWAKASLIWMLIGLALCAIFWSAIIALIVNLN